MRRGVLSVAHAITLAVVAFVVLAVTGAIVFGSTDRSNRRYPFAVSGMPSPPPTAHPVNGGCSTDSWSTWQSQGGGPAVTVDAHPVGATVYWLPARAADRCRVASTKLGAKQADSLADDIRGTRVAGDGRYSCPLDDGRSAWVVFGFGAHQRVEVIDVSLSGCGFMSAPGRSALGPENDVTDQLHRVEPPSVRTAQ